VLAVTTPSLLTAGYASFSGTSWTSLVARAPDTAAYLLAVYRMVGGLNVALGSTFIALIVGPFRRGERWAWFTLLAGNVLGFGVPMAYDQITGAIGVFEVLEFVAIAAVLGTLALSFPRGRPVCPDSQHIPTPLGVREGPPKPALDPSAQEETP
jgi:hypothetical protein